MNTKKEIYAAHGIELIKNKNTEKLVSPLGLVNKPLVNGNKKIGRGCYHFSTLPGTQLFDVVVNGMSFTVKGTCCCDCVGCYAKTGNYRYQSVKNALGMRTILAHDYADWLDANRGLTLIPPGSAYDCNGRGKWCYMLGNAVACEPRELPADVVRHGRSYCEY